MPLLPIDGYHDPDHDVSMQRLHATILRTVARLAQCSQLIRRAQAMQTAAWQQLTRPPGPVWDAGEPGEPGAIRDGDKERVLTRVGRQADGVVIRSPWGA